VAGLRSSLEKLQSISYSAETNELENLNLRVLREINQRGDALLKDISHIHSVPAVSKMMSGGTIERGELFSRDMEKLLSERVEILVVFQNSTELRLGGGFLGSYALVTIDEQGAAVERVGSSYEVDDFYNLRPAPDELNHLNQFLTFKDSNSSVFIHENAESFRYYFPDIDGVVFVNSDFFQEFLLEFGPITFDGTQINAANFYSSFIFLSDINKRVNFLDSTESKNFYKQMMPSIFDSLQSDLPKTVEFVIEQLRVRNIEYYFFDTGLNIFPKSYPENFVEIFEANYSGSKSSKNINRTVTVDALCDEWSTANLRFRYEHTGNVNYFDGGYVGQIVMLFPRTTNIVEINGVEKSWYSGEYYIKEVVDGFVHLTLFINLEPSGVYEFDIKTTNSSADICEPEVIDKLGFVVQKL
jgi:hypothetical protein